MRRLLPVAAVAVLPLAFQAPVAEAPAPVHPLHQVVVLGASVTMGMDLGTDVADVLEETILREHDPVLADHDFRFFLRPLEIATEQVEFALGADASLVVGVDFLFWFGYGDLGVEPEHATDARLALLERGLALLDRIAAPLVVGDFPDMSEAIGKMLRREQVPDAAALERLNARLAAWARERGDVIVLPLSRVIADMRSDRPLTIGRQDWPAGSSDLLLQPDRLHPTLEGLAAVTHLVAERLVAGGVVSEDDVDLDLARVLDRLGEPPPGG